MAVPERSPEQSVEQLRLRVSDADRHAVAEVLRQAAGDGRIDLTELDERLGMAYSARTYADLVPLTSDLPVVAGRSSGPAILGEPERHLAILSGVNRKGEWTVPAHLQITCVMGGADLDLRDATFATREVVITVNAFMGGADIKVAPDVNVIMEGTGVMGAFVGPSGLVHAELGPDSPTVRVRGTAVWGGVNVERKHP